MDFEKSADAKILESLLAEAKVGEVVSYDDLSRAIGRDVRQHALSALGTARRGVFKEHNIVFGVERGVGLVRLDSSGIVRSSEADRRSLQRKAKKCLRKLSVAKFDELDDEGKRVHVTASAQMGAVAMFTNKASSRKIEAKITPDTKVLPIGETLKLFG